jgi:hypothetical protein
VAPDSIAPHDSSQPENALDTQLQASHLHQFRARS